MSKDRIIFAVAVLLLVIYFVLIPKRMIEPAEAVSPQPTPTPRIYVREETDYKYISFETTITIRQNSEDGSVAIGLDLPSQMLKSDRQFLNERIYGFRINENPLNLVLKFDVMPSALVFFNLNKPVEFSGTFPIKGKTLLTLRQGIVVIEAWIE